MHKVTSLDESHQTLLNDDETKPNRFQITRKNQNDRFFIDWDLHLNVKNELLENTVDWLLETSELKLQSRSVPKFRNLCEVLLLNLGKSLLQRRWIQIPKRTVDYSPGTKPHSLGFTKRHINTIEDVLKRHELIYVIKGKKYRKDPQLSAWQPTELFDARVGTLSLASETLFNVESVRINKQLEPLTDLDLKQVEKDRQMLEAINAFLSKHSYPLKGPMRRIYSKRVGCAGRIFCEFQSISSRKVPIRQHSLIDGEQVVEVDIKASHPRMAVQEFHQEKISPDFYADIAKETDIFEVKVRKFFQVVLSSASEAQGRAAFLGEGYDSYDFKALQKWVLGRYPKLPLFQSWSLEAMNHEGTILLNVMMKGVENERVVLPIHDAVAVRQRDRDWAVRTLKEQWYEHFGFDYCEVSYK